MAYLHTIAAAAGAVLARSIAATVLVLTAVTAADAQYSVTAAWDRNGDAATAGYRVYLGTASGSYQWSQDVGNQVSTPLNLPAGTYYCVVRAYNTASQYGAASDEVSFTVGAGTPVPAAAIQASLQAPNAALVSWQTANASSASINGTPVPLTGSTTVPISETTTFTITAANAAGQTATASATVVLDASAEPEPVINTRAEVSGSRVTLSWQRNPQGSAPTDYIVSVGSYPWGEDLVRNQPVGNLLSVSADVPRGSYYARVRAANAVAVADSGEQVFFRVGSEIAPPGNLVADWSGSQATLRWGAAAADSSSAEPSEYVLEAGSAPGMADVARVPMGSATTFSVNVTSGAYFVRVRAVNSRGDSNPSREIVVAAPGTAAAPTGLNASGNGAHVRLAWNAPSGAPEILAYLVEVGSDPYHSDLGRVLLGSVTEVTSRVPRGTYFIRVRAVTASGIGQPSNEIVIRR